MIFINLPAKVITRVNILKDKGYCPFLNNIL
jgi:hypothetical protein